MSSGPSGPVAAVVGPPEPLPRVLAAELGRLGFAAEVLEAEGLDRSDLAGRLERRAFAAVVYAPSRRGPDLAEADAVLAALARPPEGEGPRPVVIVLSSSEVHEPSHHHPGLAVEERPGSRPVANPVARAWLELERRVAERLRELDGTGPLTLLRPAPVPLAGAPDPWSRLLSGRFAATLPGHDPSIQLLAPEDLARAVARVLELGDEAPGGIFQVMPAGLVPLRRALRLAGVRRVALPGALRSAARRAYLRYSWSASGDAAARELGFVARRTSAQAVAALRPEPRTDRLRSEPEAPPSFDEFGLDPGYVAAFERTLFRFLHDVWWRVEPRGTEHLPREGRAVLVGVHRGFMPWDGVMALHMVRRATGRTPRFLLHPSLLKMPFLFNYMTKLGGVPACRENSDRMLGAGELLGVFPEGIRGAFTHYRRAYRLGEMGREEYVRMALRNRVPIVPFVTVGSAEIFPVLAHLEWPWWQRFTEWPCFPVAPPFPLLPVPLPSKWHTRVLEPFHVEALHGPEAADDPEVVAALGAEVRRRMIAALEGLLARRRHWFWGSLSPP